MIMCAGRVHQTNMLSCSLTTLADDTLRRAFLNLLDSVYAFLASVALTALDRATTCQNLFSNLSFCNCVLLMSMIQRLFGICSSTLKRSDDLSPACRLNSQCCARGLLHSTGLGRNSNRV